jgi:fused signal recognition particle receptor
MLALWIVLAVVLVTLVVGLVVAVPRRARARRATPSARAATQTLEKPRPAATRRAAPPSVEAPPDTVAVPGAVEEPEPEPEPGGEPEPAPAPELRERMGKTRGLFSGYVRALRSRSSVDDQAWDDLEEALLRADVGVATTTALLEDLRGRVRDGELRGADAVVAALREDLRRSLDTEDGTGLSLEGEGIIAWLFVGVNGVGKTTTIGKVARREKAAGRSVLLAAGDTFRAAAAEQLDQWAQRTGVEIVRGAEGGDPSAVVFDAVQRAQARGNDLVLADTAGRLHTKVNLVEELKKIRRVADRDPGHVAEVLLVLDATTGQNGLTQARQFLEAVGVTGVVLTKLDGSAKGGIVIAIQRELGLPVKLVGLGEGPDDLVPFDADEFVDALFD